MCWWEDGCVVYSCCWASGAVILGSEFCRTRGHILLSQIWDSIILEGQVPILITPGIGWPSYTPRGRVPFLLPLRIRCAAVQVLDLLPYGTRVAPALNDISPCYIQVALTQMKWKTPHCLAVAQQFLFYCMYICCSGNSHFSHSVAMADLFGPTVLVSILHHFKVYL
jgi:hypothetical protein